MKYFVNIVVQIEAKDITEAVEKGNDVINHTQIDSPINDRNTKLIQFNINPENKEVKK